MKCLNLTLFFICFISAVISVKRRINKDVFDESEAKEYSFLLSKLSCARIPLNKTCTDCLETKNGFKIDYFYESKRLLRHIYKLMIQVNDKKKKVLITFAGPSIKTPNYINYIYRTGVRKNTQYGFKLETEYSRIYFHMFREKLMKKVKEILRTKGKSDYNIDFAGYSIGGSIALLAAYDLIKTGTINQVVHEPKVYTFGQLRIGDNNFVKSVESTLTNLFKIVKKDDYIMRTPNCYYNKDGNSWKCIQLDNLSNEIEDPSSSINQYIKQYNPEEKGTYMMDNFRKNVFYSQPFGTLIMYDESMDNQICKSKKDENTCEENITLPGVFTGESHLTYFGNEFGKCLK
jgi:hypothetical protein